MATNFIPKVDIRTLPGEIIGEIHLIETDATGLPTYGITTLNEVPNLPTNEVYASDILDPTGVIYTRTAIKSDVITDPSAFYVDATSGNVFFNTTIINRSVSFFYWGLGSIVWAKDINELQNRFNYAIGHKHTAATWDAPQIDNTGLLPDLASFGVVTSGLVGTVAGKVTVTGELDITNNVLLNNATALQFKDTLAGVKNILSLNGSNQIDFGGEVGITQINVKTGNVNRLQIVGDKVGINTTPTTYDLEVNGQIQSKVTDLSGNPPFIIASTNVVDNLNVDMVDGYDFDQSLKIADSPTFNNLEITTRLDASTLYVGNDYGPRTIDGGAAFFASAVPKVEIVTGVSAGTYQDPIVVRHESTDGNAVLRRLGLIFKLSSDGSTGESNKMGGIVVESSSAFANTPITSLVAGNNRITESDSTYFKIFGGTYIDLRIGSNSSIYTTASLQQFNIGSTTMMYNDSSGTHISFLYVGDVNFANKWKIDDSTDELLLVSPQGKKFRMQLEAI